MQRIRLAMIMGTACALGVVGGCGSKGSSDGPFSDVTERDRAQSTYAAAQPREGGAAPTAEVSPAAAPPVAPPAMNGARPTDAVVVRSEEAAPTAAVRAEAVAGDTAMVGDRMAVKMGPPTTQGTNRIAVDAWGGARREWPMAMAYRPSGDVMAGPYYNETELADRYGRREWQRAWLEPVDFLLNTLLMPYRAVRTPPWSEVVYSEVGEDGASTSPADVDGESIVPTRQMQQATRNGVGPGEGALNVGEPPATVRGGTSSVGRGSSGGTEGGMSGGEGSGGGGTN